MGLPLGINPLKVWAIPRIPPDKRVASSASVEARKIKRGIAKRHLECLCRYEEELIEKIDRDVIEAIYNQSGMPMPVSRPAKAKEKKERNDGTDTGVVLEHVAGYNTIQLARSRFHPVKEIREQAAANLMLMEKQEVEKWNQNAANWGTTTAHYDTLGATDVNGSEWTDGSLVDNSNDTSDTNSEWPEDDGYDDEKKEVYGAQWVENESSGDEELARQIASSGSHQATDDTPCESAICDSGIPTLPPSETFNSRLFHIFAKGEPIPDAVCSGNSQEDINQKPFRATDELAIVLNDKRILAVYLDSIEEGIKSARKTKAEKETERERARQYCAEPIRRPTEARGQGRQRELQESQGPAEEGKPLRWFQYEKTHYYNELSGRWELTVERRGQNYRLARATDTETLDHTEEKKHTLGMGNEDWNTDTDTVPDWAGANGPGWFD